MDGCQVLSLFAEWVTILLQAVPVKLRPTLLELLLGCIIARSGHITNALLAIVPRRTWTAYYKAIEYGVFSWLALARQWTILLCNVLLPEEILLAIDDTVNFRSSKKAPSTALHHDHANRPNRPKYVWGQLFVCVAMICSFKGRQGAFPLLLRMIPSSGNRSKLKAAILLTRILVRWLGLRVPIRLLLDAWYMKGPLVKDALRLGRGLQQSCLGQVGRDLPLALLLFVILRRDQLGHLFELRGEFFLYGGKLFARLIEAFACLGSDRGNCAVGFGRAKFAPPLLQ
jgi:hypothetical protein